MSDDYIVIEQHACLVCGQQFAVEVTYNSDGQVLACAPATSRARGLPNPERPLIVCVHHSGLEVAAALAHQLDDAHDHDHDHGHEDDEA